MPLAVQPPIVAALYAVPPFAAAAAFAALGALAVAVPVGARALGGSGAAGPGDGADLLRLAVVVAYLVGLVGGRRVVARPTDRASPARPRE